MKWALRSLSATPRGITLTRDGMEFLLCPSGCRADPALEERYKNPVAHRELFSVSSQHYAFVVNAFVSLPRKVIWRNTSSSFVKPVLGRLSTTSRTSVVRSVSYFFNSYNRDVLTKMLDDNHLLAHHLFTAQPHIFVSKTNPLAKKDKVKLSDLENFLI